MRAMVLEAARRPLQARDVPVPEPGKGQVLVRVRACGVCRTDLHVADGELPRPKLPLILGHEIVGVVERAGRGVKTPRPGARVGVPWLAWTCGRCERCRAGRENLCERALFTGYTRDGGYAQYAVADARWCLELPRLWSDEEAAPLLCAGLIGYRALRLAGPGRRLGLYGFGAAAHLICRVARAQGRRVYAFTRDGDRAGQDFARKLGCAWAGGASAPPPEPLDAAIIFAPAGELVPAALRAVGPGGIVVCGGIHMSDIPGFPYELLWRERELRSVANLTRQDGVELLRAAAKARVRPAVTVFPLEKADEALGALRAGKVKGAVVLRVP